MSASQLVLQLQTFLGHYRCCKEIRLNKKYDGFKVLVLGDYFVEGLATHVPDKDHVDLGHVHIASAVLQSIMLFCSVGSLWPVG